MTTYFDTSEAHALDDLCSIPEQAGLDIFTHVENGRPSELDLTIESIRQCAETISEMLESILHRPVPPSRWGINA